MNAIKHKSSFLKSSWCLNFYVPIFCVMAWNAVQIPSCSDTKYTKFLFFQVICSFLCQDCQIHPANFVHPLWSNYSIHLIRFSQAGLDISVSIMIGILYHKPLFTHFFPTPRRKLNYFKWVIYYCNPIFFFFCLTHSQKHYSRKQDVST